MKLKDLASSAYLYLERYVNQRNYSRFCNYSEVSEDFRPSSKKENFHMPFIPLDKSSIGIVESPYLDIQLAKLLINSNEIKFFFHPDNVSLDDLFITNLDSSKISNISVGPTASTRTILAEMDGRKFFIKTHLPKRISRFNRRLSATSIQHSIQVSDDLCSSVLPPDIGFLPETFGVWQKKSGWGYLIRDIKPFPQVEEQRVLLPLFSLHSPDRFSYADEPLLVQLIKQKKADPIRYTLKNIILPIIRHWCLIAQERGILLESHGQNTLIELDNDKNITRIIYRDFQSLMIDTEVRKRKGLLNNFKNDFKKHRIGIDSHFNRSQEYSLTYDYFVCHHGLEPIVQCLETYFQIDGSKIRDAVKRSFRRYFPDYKKFFPPTTYRFLDKAFPNNQSEIFDTNKSPLWR